VDARGGRIGTGGYGRSHAGKRPGGGVHAVAQHFTGLDCRLVRELAVRGNDEVRAEGGCSRRASYFRKRPSGRIDGVSMDTTPVFFRYVSEARHIVVAGRWRNGRAVTLPIDRRRRGRRAIPATPASACRERKKKK